MARTAVSASPALRLAPSGRSLAVGFGLLAIGFALYAGARESSVFAVHEVRVDSVPPAQARLVGRELDNLAGTSLLEVDQDVIQRRLERLPHVHLLGYDRAFPNTLRVRVSVERAVAVLRRGSDRWLVSAEGRVLRPLQRTLRRPLPVVWLAPSVEPEVGEVVRAAEPARAVRILAAVRAADSALGRRVWFVKLGEQRTATAILHDHFEIRLGPATDLPLKLAAASRVLAALRRENETAAYVDVSVPARPVIGGTLDPLVEP